MEMLTKREISDKFRDEHLMMLKTKFNDDEPWTDWGHHSASVTSKKSRGPIHLVVDETVYKEWEDRLERAFTTATSLEAEQDSGNINRTQSMVTLNESFPQRTDSGSGPRFLRQAQHGCYLQKSEGSKGFHQIIDFLTTSHISTLENGDMEITTTIVGKVKVISEASIRRHLKLEDSDGISTLPTSECPIPIT
ncbi:hypothetical protein Tco_0514110 [Tanacetum coccineum]